MSKLVMSLPLSAAFASTISVSQLAHDVLNISDSDWSIGFAQGFIWHPHRVTFLPPANIGGYWVEICTANAPALQLNTTQAVCVPFTIPKSNRIYVSGNSAKSTTIDLLHGNYHLLFESRKMEAAEASKLHGFEWCSANPAGFAEVIRLTFLPTKDLPLQQLPWSLKPQSTVSHRL
ncbi:MAG: competence protein ComJ, partial [Cyanobacteria bacterium J06636_16]